jgi:hypothetical protein
VFELHSIVQILLGFQSDLIPQLHPKSLDGPVVYVAVMNKSEALQNAGSSK